MQEAEVITDRMLLQTLYLNCHVKLHGFLIMHNADTSCKLHTDETPESMI